MHDVIGRKEAAGIETYGTAGLTLYDWQGQQRWQVELPAPFNAYSLSPDGRHLAAVIRDQEQPALQYWLDGKPGWRLALPGSSSRLALYSLDNGQVFCWQGDRLLVIRDGHVIAEHPNLPIIRDNPNSRYWFFTQYEYRPSSDGLTLIGSGIEDKIFRGTYGPGVDYYTLSIVGKRVIATRGYHASDAGGGYLICREGRILANDGTVYTRDGVKHQDSAWTLPNILKGSAFDVWGISEQRSFRAAVQAHTAEVLRYDSNHYRFRLLDLQTFQAWDIPQTNECTAPPCSEDGRYAAVLMHYDRYRPPDAVGRVSRLLSPVPKLREALLSLVPVRNELQLYRRPGKLQARLPLGKGGDIALVGKTYRIYDYFVSPDGRSLIVYAADIKKDDQKKLLFYRW